MLTRIILALSVVLMLISAGAMVENVRLRHVISRQQSLIAQAAAEKEAAEKSFEGMKNELSELRAQKALYTATIETIAKKD
jgi:predicted  nucleic acid-binding Zn-ribbon protein